MSDAANIVHVDLGPRSYDISIGSGLLAAAAATATAAVESRYGAVRGQRKAAIVTDANVTAHAETVRGSFARAGWQVELITIPAGEGSKSLTVVSGIYDRLVALPADRKTLLVAVGGGVIGDLAGFVAATFNRGLPFVQVPTTLLADVDSSVGGKVGVNHPRAKNLIGAFYQPGCVIIDTSTLTTLPDREYRSGLAEVVKYGVILDSEFFNYLESHVAALNARDVAALSHAITCSCRLKADVVEQDEEERTGLRAVLNYGHTFAHAYEALAGYGELLHGEAVSIGMTAAAKLAVALGRISHDDEARQKRLLESLHLPTLLPKKLAQSMSEDAILDCMRLDKKTVGGQLRFVLPDRIGHVELVDGVPEESVRMIIRDALGC
jgi:3-dehydroquinate synthase